MGIEKYEMMDTDAADAEREFERHSDASRLIEVMETEGEQDPEHQAEVLVDAIGEALGVDTGTMSEAGFDLAKQAALRALRSLGA